jgi:hypothetical protein
VKNSNGLTAKHLKRPGVPKKSRFYWKKEKEKR